MAEDQKLKRLMWAGLTLQSLGLDPIEVLETVARAEQALGPGDGLGFWAGFPKEGAPYRRIRETPENQDLLG